MKLGLLTFNIAKEWDLDTLLEKVKELKFDGVEFRVDSEHRHGVELERTKEERAEIRKKCEDAGVVVCGLGSGCKYDSPDENDVRENIERTKRLLELCADVGASGLKVFGNNFHEKEGIPREKTIEQVGKAVAECAKTAEDLGVDLRFEMHGDFTAPDDCLKVVELADSPRICLIFNCNKTDPIDGTIAPTLLKVMPHVRHVHLHDLSDENFPYDELVRLLRQNNFEGFCVAEIKESADPERVLTYYRALWKAYEALAEKSL